MNGARASSVGHDVCKKSCAARNGERIVFFFLYFAFVFLPRCTFVITRPLLLGPQRAVCFSSVATRIRETVNVARSRPARSLNFFFFSSFSRRRDVSKARRENKLGYVLNKCAADARFYSIHFWCPSIVLNAQVSSALTLLIQYFGLSQAIV